MWAPSLPEASVGVSFNVQLSASSITDRSSLVNQPDLSCVPLLPVAGPAELVPEITRYIASMDLYASHPIPPFSTRVVLLPHVTLSAPSFPLSEHNTYILSDLCHSLSDVAALADTEEGRSMLQHWLGADGIAIADFWQEELIL